MAVGMRHLMQEHCLEPVDIGWEFADVIRGDYDIVPLVSASFRIPQRVASPYGTNRSKHLEIEGKLLVAPVSGAGDPFCEGNEFPH